MMWGSPRWIETFNKMEEAAIAWIAIVRTLHDCQDALLQGIEAGLTVGFTHMVEEEESLTAPLFDTSLKA